MAALNGYGPVPIDKDFTYCELGCGKGLKRQILAESPVARGQLP